MAKFDEIPAEYLRPPYLFRRGLHTVQVERAEITHGGPIKVWVRRIINAAPAGAVQELSYEYGEILRRVVH